MKITDLMVGDWVYVSGKPVKISRDDLATMLIFLDDDSKIDPITFAEDILVKNGFVYRDEEETCATDAFHHWQLDGHSFALNSTQYFRKEKKDDMPRFDVAGIAIRYVHQLQHLMRLAGIEKEIEL